MNQDLGTICKVDICPDRDRINTLGHMSQSSATLWGPVQIERQCHFHEALQQVYI